MDILNPFFLILSGHYDRDPGLDKYLMALISQEDGQVNEWTCTSSHTKGQQRGDQHTWGGIIPPVHHCQNLKEYEVDLRPIWMPDNKGVRGYFYRILPYQVLTTQGKKRGDFGIHLDANAPGSLGCPVMDKRNFDDFHQQMKSLTIKHKLSCIPFFPLYS